MDLEKVEAQKSVTLMLKIEKVIKDIAVGVISFVSVKVLFSEKHLEIV